MDIGEAQLRMVGQKDAHDAPPVLIRCTKAKLAGVFRSAGVDHDTIA